MPSLFAQIVDKAQSALSPTPHHHDLPVGGQTAATGTDGQPQDQGEAVARKSHTLENLTHQFRTIQQQYSSVTPVQKIITSQKGVSIDLDSLGRDLHTHSKELYLWGQGEAEDIKDVSDRLGWLTYTHGALASSLANKVQEARTPFKVLRAADNGLAPRRAIRANIENQISKLEHDNQKHNQYRIAELKDQLHKAEQDDLDNENEVEVLKRKALRETEEKTWEAIREYAEKLVLLSQAASSITPALPVIPPSKDRPYEGAQATASVRASMQQSLDQYKPNSLALALARPSVADIKRSDTRSFGETHAQELSRIGSSDTAHPGAPATPPRSPSPNSYPGHTHQPINATKPNPAPAPVPVPNDTKSNSPPGFSSPPFGSQPPPIPPRSGQAPSETPSAFQDKGKGPAVPYPVTPEIASTVPPEPTIAETGVRKSSGPEGPGPISGSLLNLRSGSKNSQAPLTQSPVPISQSIPAVTPPADGGATHQYESAEDEKNRLRGKEQEGSLAVDSPGSGALPTPPHEGVPAAEPKKYETAEEEKRRREREEREKLFFSSGGSEVATQGHGDNNPPHQSAAGLPPYVAY